MWTGEGNSDRGRAKKMTIKEQAIRLIEGKGCTWELQRAHYPDWAGNIEVFPPAGYIFDEQLSSLVCHDWNDILKRLPQFELTGEILV